MVAAPAAYRPVVRCSCNSACPCCCRGCALLVGVGGSGKQSLAKFAAFVADCDLRTVSMSAGYNLARFREEVKHVLKVGSALCICSPTEMHAWLLHTHCSERAAPNMQHSDHLPCMHADCLLPAPRLLVLRADTLYCCLPTTISLMKQCWQTSMAC